MNVQESKPLPVLQWLRPLLIGLAVGIIAGVAMLLLAAALVKSVDVPRAAITPLAVGAASVGAFFGGLAAALAARRRGLVFGALCGVLLFLLILAAGIFRLGGVGGGYALIKLAALTVAGAVGGVLGVNRR